MCSWRGARYASAAPSGARAARKRPLARHCPTPLRLPPPQVAASLLKGYKAQFKGAPISSTVAYLRQ